MMIKNVCIEFGFNSRNMIYSMLFHRLIFLTLPSLKTKQTESKQTRKMENSAVNVHCLKYGRTRVSMTSIFPCNDRIKVQTIHHIQ